MSDIENLMMSKPVGKSVWCTEAQDIVEIPYEPAKKGDISRKKGVPREYSKSQADGGKIMELPEFNGILKGLSEGYLRSLQAHAAPYNEQIGADVGYALGARCLVYQDYFTGLPCTYEMLEELDAIDGVTLETRRMLLQTIEIESRKPTNKDSPLIPDNLFGSWYVIDGRQFGDFIMCSIQRQNAPLGYIDVAPALEEGTSIPKYRLDKFPRVNALLTINNGTHAWFRKVDDEYFTMQHLGGLFMRIYSNNANATGAPNLDPGRKFYEIQRDAMAPLLGQFMKVSENSPYSSAAGDVYNRFYTESGFIAPPVVSVPIKDLSKKTGEQLEYINNCFSTPYDPTVADLTTSSRYYSDSTSDSDELKKTICGNVVRLDTSNHPLSGNEIRPKNFCIKVYLKC